MSASPEAVYLKVAFLRAMLPTMGREDVDRFSAVCEKLYAGGASSLDLEELEKLFNKFNKVKT